MTDKKQPRTSSGMDIPDYAIEQIARCMLPMLQKYYESEEGQRELTEWKRKNDQAKEA